jgi:prolyl-tRNA synthetase
MGVERRPPPPRNRPPRHRRRSSYPRPPRHAVETYDELAERAAANAGWSLAHWCGDAACEARVKTETKATIRCIPRNAPPEPGRCIVCGGVSERRVVFARAY